MEINQVFSNLDIYLDNSISLASLVLGCAGAIVFIKNFSFANYDSLLLSGGRWIFMPAVKASNMFDKVFKTESVRNRFFSVDVMVSVMIFSCLANMLCIFMILIFHPDSLSVYSWPHLKILGQSYFLFMLFNFFGDYVSIIITSRIAHKLSLFANSVHTPSTRKVFFYMVSDMLGIGLGYFLTLSLVITSFLFHSSSEFDINNYVQEGVLGNILIPIGLIIYSASDSIGQTLIVITSALSIGSIAIPTLIYLFCIVLFFLVVLVKQSSFFIRGNKAYLKLDSLLTITIYLSGVWFLLSIAMRLFLGLLS